MTTTAARPRSSTRPRKQVEQARLHRDVEAAGRLVHEDQPRAGDEVAGDLQALAHAAGEGAGFVVDAVVADLDPRQPVDRGLADLAVVPVADRHQPLADIGAGRHRHAQPVGRVLVDETPVGAHQEAALRLAHAVEVAERAVAHAVGDRAGSRRQPRREAVEQRRLARAGFADDRQHFARPQLEARRPRSRRASRRISTARKRAAVVRRSFRCLRRRPTRRHARPPAASRNGRCRSRRTCARRGRRG